MGVRRKVTSLTDGGYDAGPTRHVGLHVPLSLCAQIEKMAKANDRSFSAEVRRAMRAHVEREDERKAA
jgi:hypothetical protein